MVGSKKLSLKCELNWERITGSLHKMFVFCWRVVQFTTIIQDPKVLNSLINSLIYLFLPILTWHLLDVLVHLAVFRHFYKRTTYVLTFIQFQIPVAWLRWQIFFLSVANWFIENTGKFANTFHISGLCKL